MPGHIDWHCLLSMHPPRYKINAWTSNGNMNSGNNYTQSSTFTNRSSSLFLSGTSILDLSQSDLRIGITYRPLHLFFLYRRRSYALCQCILHDRLSSGQWIVHRLIDETQTSISNCYFPWNFGIPPSLHCPKHGLICYIDWHVGFWRQWWRWIIPHLKKEGRRSRPKFPGRSTGCRTWRSCEGVRWSMACGRIHGIMPGEKCQQKDVSEDFYSSGGFPQNHPIHRMLLRELRWDGVRHVLSVPQQQTWWQWGSCEHRTQQMPPTSCWSRDVTNPKLG